MTARPAGRPVVGAALRARREELGRSLAEVASATRIPIEHLRAIEEERLDDLPAGPYAAAYVAALEEHLDTTVSAPSGPQPPVSGLPLPIVRAIAVLSLLAMAAAILWQVAATRDARPAVATEPAVPVRDERVVLVTRRTVELAVRVDGEEKLRRIVPGGETLTFEAFDRIEIDLPAVDAVRIEHNGATVVPQGRQDHFRTLVFIDDVGTGA